MADKYINSRIIHKHDTASNWEKAVNFIPKKGEIIIYDIDEEYGNNTPLLKIGDGVTTVSSLPFATPELTDLIFDSGNSGYYAATPKSVKTAYDVANTANSTANNAMPKSGGTFTGAIILSGDPTEDLNPTTKSYVDSNTNTLVDLINANLGLINQNTEAINGKAPKSHATTDTTYGKGTSSNYGHVKLSDSTSSTSAASSGGVAATPKAVKAAYDLANAAMPKSGGTFTGNVTGKYFTGTWLQTTEATVYTGTTDFTPCVLDSSGWLYKGSFVNMLSALGVEFGTATINFGSTKTYVDVKFKTEFAVAPAVMVSNVFDKNLIVVKNETITTTGFQAVLPGGFSSSGSRAFKWIAVGTRN